MKAPSLVKTGAIGYVRVSTDKQEISPEAQRDAIMQWGELNEIKIIAIHSDVCSGSVPWTERPGLTKAYNDLRRHEAAWLVVAKQDRLSRDLYNSLHLQREMNRYDARVICCTDDPDAVQTPEKELMANMLGSFAQFERALIRGRIKAALDVRRAQGIRMGAPPLEASEQGRCVIWAVWTLKDRGHGAKTIAKLLNRCGAIGPRGGWMHERNVQRILRKPRPEEEPKQWHGLLKTWKQFETVRTDKESSGDRPSPRKVGRPKKGERRAVGREETTGVVR